MNDPLAELTKILDELRAAELLDAIRDEHRQKFLRILTAPSQYEAIRQAICNIDPLMEGNISASRYVKMGQVILMDTSLMDASLPDWDFNKSWKNSSWY